MGDSPALTASDVNDPKRTKLATAALSAFRRKATVGNAVLNGAFGRR
jgi:hypothetical protein